MTLLTFPSMTATTGKDINLPDILRPTGLDKMPVAWELRIQECAGNPAAYERIYEATERGETWTGDELGVWFGRGVQLIDGKVVGRLPGVSGPKVVLCAVDGTDWDVESDDVDLLARVRRAFPESRELA